MGKQIKMRFYDHIDGYIDKHILTAEIFIQKTVNGRLEVPMGVRNDK